MERAWELFAEGGYLERDDDPAALAVLGRLCKDRARRGDGRDYAAAARAYGAANALSPAPYLAINAATSGLLAGDRAGAGETARATLAQLDGSEPPADTPYFLAATRAEALLLLGDEARARAAFAEAARHDPDGWDDRAVTLAQLRLIGAALALPLDWLEDFAPPPSLHFAGHMGIAAGGSSEAALSTAVSAFLKRQRPGFAWGALAAGADIVIAEHLLAAGCALHAVLPCPPELFETQSVTPAGSGWVARFRDVLAAAASVRAAGPGASSVHDPVATAFAGELAIGGALLNARRLATGVMQLIAADEAGGGANTRRQAEIWPRQAGGQTWLTIARDSAVEAGFPPEHPDPARVLAIHVAIGLDSLHIGDFAASAEIGAIRAPLAAAMAGLDPGAVRADHGGWDLVLTDSGQALDVVLEVQRAARRAGIAPPSVGIALAIATLHRDPASGMLVPYGPGPRLARRLRDMAPPGVTLVSDAAAVTLIARDGAVGRTELYHLGESELGGAVHSLSAPPEPDRL